DREFLPWAFAIARNQARAARQARQRERLAFDQDVVDRVADRAAERAAVTDDRQVALAECLGRLPADQREIVERRYRDGEPIARVAEALGKTAGALGVAVFRIRQALARCIEGVLAGERAQ
ncbi:MAG: sigma-70 family RNA polymerase sigma factor, partial [Planctomycetes bacterium]|nr:sigma-70 family RNA polymerase sigma factor [Planctomycetota bacterium]